jgi:hypothetical protein
MSATDRADQQRANRQEELSFSPHSRARKRVPRVPKLKWCRWTEHQRQQVTESFARYISAIYADRFDSYGGEKFIGRIVVLHLLLNITDGQRGQLIKLLSLLGFTPADRSRITAVESKDEADPFAKFVQ